MLVLAHDLTIRLPLTAAALNDGLIDAYKAQIIAEATRVLDDAAAAAAETLVIPHSAGLTPGQIRVRIARAVLKADPRAARVRREQAQKCRGGKGCWGGPRLGRAAPRPWLRR